MGDDLNYNFSLRDNEYYAKTQKNKILDIFEL